MQDKPVWWVRLIHGCRAIKDTVASPGIAPVRIAGIYACIGILWILLSDNIAASLFRDIHVLTVVNSLKGVAYIGATTIMVYVMTRTAVKKLRRAEADLLRSSAEISRLAYIDALTGLPNRKKLERLLEQHGTGQGALIVLDMDRFRVIGDLYGAGISDAVVAHMATRMLSALAPKDILARFHTDVFGIYTPDAASAELLAEQLRLAFEAPMQIFGRELMHTLCLGLAREAHARDTAGMFRNAEAALHEAKARGGDMLVVYTEAVQANIDQRAAMERELRIACDEGQFILHYQPQIRARDGLVQGVEALVRWQHPDRGLIFPGEFIEWAEEYRLIREMGIQILREACKQQVAWACEGHDIEMSVNLSPVQMQDTGLAEQVADILRDTGMNPSRLVLEITEGQAVADIDGTRFLLDRLHRLGVRLALDDFGTGYSSLSYLAQLPIQVVKIDRHFVQQMEEDQLSITILQAVMMISGTCGFEVVAEGVETDEQRQLLGRLGCHLLQGYFYSRPVPPDYIPDIIIRRHA